MPQPVHRRFVVVASLLMSIALGNHSSASAEADPRNEIAILESALFESDLSVERLKSSLAELGDASKREAAKSVLSTIRRMEGGSHAWTVS
ncbi:MAG: hypothetical protein WD069_22875 [Planctomycetales bacterium]